MPPKKTSKDKVVECNQERRSLDVNPEPSHPIYPDGYVLEESFSDEEQPTQDAQSLLKKPQYVNNGINTQDFLASFKSSFEDFTHYMAQVFSQQVAMAMKDCTTQNIAIYEDLRNNSEIFLNYMVEKLGPSATLKPNKVPYSNSGPFIKEPVLKYGNVPILQRLLNDDGQPHTSLPATVEGETSKRYGETSRGHNGRPQMASIMTSNMPGGHDGGNSNFNQQRSPLFDQGTEDNRPNIHQQFGHTNGNHSQSPDQPLTRAEVMDVLREVMGGSYRQPMCMAYSKPYPDYVDQIYDYPKGYKIPDFSLFSGEDKQTTYEHIGRFTNQCGDMATSGFLKLRLFGNSLTGAAFQWFLHLPPGSIRIWEEMETQFHLQFYKAEPEVSLVDLATIYQQPGEKVEDYVSRFKQLKNQCYVYLEPADCINLVVNGLNLQNRKHFSGQNFYDIGHLVTAISKFEEVIDEGNQWPIFSREKDEEKEMDNGLRSGQLNYE